MTWFREPLIHFLLLGALLFAAYSWINRDATDEPQVVRITEAEVNWLKETWSRQRQRPPDDEELRGLVVSYLKEELLAREAQEIGLDENDTIVRRRLAQKMEFIVQDMAHLAEPNVEELHRIYAENSQAYQEPAHVSFVQIYFLNKADAESGLKGLQKGSQEVLGDRTMLEPEYAGADPHLVTSVFGPEFSNSIFALEAGTWQGPVASGYGYHLVRISELRPAEPRPFDEVRADVEEEWRREQQAVANEAFFTALLKKYDVQLDESVKPLIGPLARVTK